MGREKWDTCKNCIHSTDNKDGTYRCELDKKDQDENDWCKHHKSEDE